MQVSAMMPSLSPLTPMVSTPKTSPANGFGDQALKFLNQVNDLQNTSDGLTRQLAVGDSRSLHAVMIASEEAGLALSTALTLRNKAVEAYQEVMKMQV